MYVHLSKKDINQILELQEVVFNSLSEEDKDFLLPKSKEKLLAHFDKGNHMQGYMLDGKLVAQSLIVNPSPEFPETGMVDMQDQGDIEEGITVLQGLIVHPNYQGKGLSSKMINHWIKSAAKEGKETALAEVEVHNYKSYGGFLHAGLEIDSIGVDPDDGCEVFNIKGNPQKAMLKQMFNQCAANCEDNCITVEANDISSIKTAFNNSYKGVYWNKKDKQLILAKACNQQLALQAAI